MVKKAIKESPHLRVRIEPKLLARLEKAREKNSNTLTGEIVSRLDESFNTADKLALFQQAQDQRFDEFRQWMADRRAAIEQERDRAISQAGEENRKNMELLRAELMGSYRELEQEIKMLQLTAAVIDTLIGDDVASKETVRSIAVLLAANPGWAGTPDGVQKITQAAVSAIQSVAEKKA